MTAKKLLAKVAAQKEKIRPVKLAGFFHNRGVTVAVLLLLAVTVAVFAGLQAYARSFTYVVYLDEEEVGFVAGEEEILRFVAGLYEKEARNTGLEVRMSQEIRVEKERRPGAVAREWEVKDKLRQNIRFDAYAYEIVVDDRPVLAVASLQDYKKVVDELKSSFVSGRDNAVVREIALNERVEAVWTTVDPGRLYSADKAAEILKRGTDRRETYLVSRGDSLWTIARSHNMTVEQVRAANPHLQSTDRLQVGEELELVVAQPIVRVSVTEDVTVTESIPFNTTYQNDSKMYQGTSRIITPGKTGRREVVYRITRENGRETGREILSQTITEEPKTQVVARGTAIAPVRGTGQFMWPVAGGGRISSRFGPRAGGFHYGVDVSTAIGTAVLAVDAGVVVFSGRAGTYGILVTIDHGNGYITKYAHLSASLVSVGQKVQKGQQIAKVGSTGRSTGPHLHFEILRNGARINPLNFFSL
jgi:murein DD-endopeptidase MepM/ murein hydrolase activator NlpD